MPIPRVLSGSACRNYSPHPRTWRCPRFLCPQRVVARGRRNSRVLKRRMTRDLDPKNLLPMSAFSIP